MPIVHIRSNLNLSAPQKKRALATIATAVSSHLEKPLSDVMVSYQYLEMLMDGSSDPALHADITCLSGLLRKSQADICHALHGAIVDIADIAPERIYLHFHLARPNRAWRFVDGRAICPADHGRTTKGTARGKR
jgi:phenylpyruvate tautomerase PptA (4-oxalocrotonate tautomerase family)